MSKVRGTSRFAVVNGFALIAVVSGLVLAATVGATPRFGFIQSVGEFLGMPVSSTAPTPAAGGSGRGTGNFQTGLADPTPKPRSPIIVPDDGGGGPSGSPTPTPATTPTQTPTPPPTYPVTIFLPANVAGTLAGVFFTGPAVSIYLLPGAYTLATTTPQTLGAGRQAAFNSWSDGGAISHTITVVDSPLTITGAFTTQYQLTTAANPGAGGTVTPASGSFHNSAAVVNVSAAPNAGYQFTGWTGAVAAPASAATTVTMDTAKSITANFQPCTNPTVVTTNANSGAGSLRQAIIDTCPGGTITFGPAVTGTITLTSGQIVINKNLTITGPGANVLAVSGNHASRIFHISAGITASISGLTIANGTADATAPEIGGAGIYTAGTLALSTCTFSNNTATGTGLGGGVSNRGLLTVTSSTFSGNSALDGGGIHHLGNVASTISNSTFSGNSATRNGGGIYFYERATLTNSTVTANSATSAGGGLYLNDYTPDPMVLTSSIIADNSSPSGPDIGILLMTISESNNIIGIYSGGTSLQIPPGLPNIHNSYVGTAAEPVNPQIGALAFNGGPTKTHSLLAGSIAIDKGSNPLSLTLDQRGTGFPRAVDQPSITNATVGGPDIGAFEYGDLTPPTVTSIDDDDADNSVGINTMLTYTVTFSEDINGATVTAGDFNNAGTATVIIGTVTEGTPGVVSVQVTPTTTGTLILQIPTGSVISDLVGNNLVVPVQDNDTVNVVPETTAVVDGSGNLVITDANGGTSTDNITISCTPPNLIISDPANSINVSILLSSITGSITVNTLGGNDTLTLNLAGCNFTAGGVFFNGGDPTTGPGDKLIIVGGSTTTQTFNFTNEHDGSVVLAGARSGTITYTGLEPVSSTITAANVVLNYGPATETITVSQDGGTPAQTLVDSNVGAESVSFINPTTSLQINGGDTGNDTINVNGFGTSGGGFNAGLTINGGTGNDTVNLNADINFASGNNLDVDLQNDNASPGVDRIVFGTGANLILTGTGTASLQASRDVFLQNGSSVVTENGNLDVRANQQTTATGGHFYGVYMINGRIQATGIGVVSVAGRGGNGAGGDEVGVSMEAGSIISGGSAGTATVTGTGGTTTGNGNRGLQILGAGTIITSAGSNVSVTGVGGGGSGASTSNRGVFVNSGGTISAGGTGNVSVNGTGGNSTSGGLNFGVLLNAAGSQITSGGGNVSVIGTGGTSTVMGGDNNDGVRNQFGQISAGGSGTVTVTGNAGPMASYGTFLIGGTITSAGGNIVLNGTGAGPEAEGIQMQSSASISGVGSASVTVNGDSGTDPISNWGLRIQEGASITSVNGNIAINATNPVTSPHRAFSLTNVGGVGAKVETTGAGSITVTSNTFEIESTDVTMSAGANSVNLRQRTNNTPIELGAADTVATTLQLSDSELDRITAGTLNIGNATSGTITVSADITRTAATNMTLVSDGDVIISGGQVNTGGGTLLLDPGVSPDAVRPTKSLTDVTASTLSFGSDLAIAINGATVDTQYDQLNVTGAVNLAGVSLVLSGTHVATPGQQFVIVNNDGSDAIVGTFNGLPQGALIANFLGAPGVNANISYTEGSNGNDAVITVDNIPPKVTTITPLQGATGVDRNGNITLNFSEAVNISAGGVTLDCAGVQAFSPTLPQNGVTSIVIDPTNTLPAGALCTVTGVAPNLKDTTGNQLDGNGNGLGGDNFVLTYTTACTANPIVVTNADSGIGSLREAVDIACPASTITFSNAVVSPIALTGGQIDIGKDLTITGPATVTGGAGNSVFIINRPVVVGMDKLTVSGGGGAALSLGGGIFNQGGTLTLTSSTISGNTAVAAGGGICNNGTLTLVNSTISGNSGGTGGGIYNLGTLNLTNVTIANNTAAGGGSGVFNAAGLAQVRNSVIAANVNNDTVADVAGVFTGGGFNLIGNVGTANGFVDGVNSNQVGSGANILDPRIAPLANNGGPTQTHALCVAAGVPHASCTGLSPAIDKGAAVVPALTTDQRGETRPLDNPSIAPAAGGNNSDIGAYEVQNTPPTINTVFGLIRQRGTPASNSTIANVTDIESGNGSVVVTVNGGAAATVNGVTVSNIVNTNGTITADVVADCTATAALFTLTATDNGGLTDTASFGVLALPNTAPALTYSSQTMTAGTTLSFGPATGPSDNGTVGAVTLQSVTPNTGLAGNVDPAGQVNITGAPTVGVYTVVVSVTDNCGAATTAVVTVNVTCPTITVGPASLANGTATAPYSQTITAGPAGGNYTFAVTSGALPAGLTLNPTSGLLSGTPTANGTFNFRITATGFGGCSGWRDYTVTIAKADTTTTVVSSQPTSTFGEAVTFTATVTPSAPATGIPTGTMNFLDNGNPIAACQAVGLNEAGQAACPASTLTAGTHTISAVYSGSGVYNTSTGTTSQTVDKRVLTITAEDKTRVFGAPNPALTFLITGFVNGETFATSGVAGAPSVTTAATQVIPVGSYPIAAALGGLIAANYSFTFVPGTLTVTQAATTTTITNAAALAANPTTIGQAYAVNWQTSPVAPSTGVPTGTVTVTDGTDTCTAAVGALTCNLTSTTFGPKNITATYGGDSNMTGSTSAAVSHAVQIGITGNVKQFGTNANLAGVTITLSGSAAAVTVTDANGNYGFAVPTSGGSYVLTPSGLSKTYEPILRSYTNVTANITNADFTAYDILGAGANPRHVRVQNTVTTGGEAAVVPVMMVSRGNEVKIAFSLAYDMAVMGTPTVACGYDTAGCSLTVNTSQPGRLGITLTPAAVLIPGLKEIVKVTFQTVPNTLTSTPVSFDDIPTVRDIRNAEGNPLPAIYGTGFVTFTQNSLGLEGDVVDPNGNPAGGDGVKANDVTVISQRVTSPNTTQPFATTPNQFQRADVNVPCGNGGIDAGDVTVITQLALGIIAPIGACGPATPTGSTSRPEDSEGTARIIRAVNTTAVAGGTVTVSFVLVSQGNEASASYSVTFPQGTLTNPQVAAGSGVPSGTTVLTNSEAAQGRIGVLIATPNSYTAGTRQMITITFNVSAQATAGTYPIGFSSTPVGQNVSAAAGGALLPTTYEPGNVVIGPTAAGVEVSGKVQTADGRGLRNATVTITDAEGNRRTATTGSFGSYRFDDIEAGKTYVIAVTSQRFRFASRTVNVTDSLTDVDFNGQE